MTSETSWAQAWTSANTHFYSRERPRDHFETSAHPGPELARALATMAIDTDDRIGNPERFDLVDIGAGDGELMVALLSALRELSPDLARRCVPVAVDIRPPSMDDPRVTWCIGDALRVLPQQYTRGINGLVVAHEWLDDLAMDIVERSPSGELRYVNIDVTTGVETLGDAVGEDERGEWLRRWWWPVTGRAEVGLSRDRAWQAVCGLIHQGRAVAIDYAHTRQQRSRGDCEQGTVRGYRDSRLVQPIPDGSCNITGHVALDACAHAVGGSWTLTDQRTALSRVAVPLPPPSLAATNPDAYAQQLQSHMRVAALRRIPGPGSMSWLVQEIGQESGREMSRVR
jgi:SAM-dependent MidA family methyltransferase